MATIDSEQTSFVWHVLNVDISFMNLQYESLDEKEKHAVMNINTTALL